MSIYSKKTCTPMKRYSLYNPLTIILFLNYVFCAEERVMVLESSGLSFSSENAENLVSSSEKGMVIVNDGKTEAIVQMVKSDSVLVKKIREQFNALNCGLSKVTNFNDYYDILAYIDKSIVLTYELGEMFAVNFENNKKIVERLKKDVKSDRQNFETTFKEVQKLWQEPPKKQELSNNQKEIKSEATFLKKRDVCMENYVSYYLKADVSVYLTTNNRIINELIGLQTALTKLRGLICPLGLCDDTKKQCALKENEYTENMNFFRGEFKKFVSRVYQNLFDCHERESKNSVFLFDALKTISNTFKEYTKQLNEYKKDFEKK